MTVLETGPVSSKVSRHTLRIERLAHEVQYGVDFEQTSFAARYLAELAQTGLEIKEEILRTGVFPDLWKLAKRGILRWADKWFPTIDDKRLTFKKGTFSFSNPILSCF